MTGKIEHINPAKMMQSPAFSQIITTTGNGKTIYIGGQNAVNAKGELIGKGDIQAQTKQIMENFKIGLEACGASFENLIKLNIYIVQGQSALAGFQAAQPFLAGLKPPIITGIFVSGLAHPDYLVEVEGIAFIPE